MSKNYDGIEALALAIVGELSKDYKIAYQNGDRVKMEEAKAGMSKYSAVFPCSIDDFCKLIEENVEEL